MRCIEYSLEFQDELEYFCSAMYEALGFNFKPEGTHSDFRNINHVYTDPGGAFFVLGTDNKVIGTIGLKIIDEKMV